MNYSESCRVYGPYSDEMIQRLIDRWKEVGTGPYYENLSTMELGYHIRSAEHCGDATADCGERGAEYQAARAQGMAQLWALLDAKSALAGIAGRR